MILADVAREDASVILSDLKDLGVHQEGAITVEPIDTQISERAERAIEHAPGSPADAVVWEEVEARTSEHVELSGVFLAFMVLAGLLAAVGIYQDSPILIVGAMVVGPEFGPLAGFCVALVQRQQRARAALGRRARGRLPALHRRRLRDDAALQGRRRLRRDVQPRRTTASRTSSPSPTSSPSSSPRAPARPGC